MSLMSSKDRHWEFCALYYGDAISSLITTIWKNEKQRSGSNTVA
jgi:hypothetical protein